MSTTEVIAPKKEGFFGSLFKKSLSAKLFEYFEANKGKGKPNELAEKFLKDEGYSGIVSYSTKDGVEILSLFVSETKQDLLAEFSQDNKWKKIKGSF